MSDWVTVFDWQTIAGQYRVQVHDIPGSAHTNVRLQHMAFREEDTEGNGRFSRIPMEERKWETKLHSEANHPIDTDD